MTPDESNSAIRAQSKVAGAEVHPFVTVFPVQVDCGGYIGVSMVQEKDGIGKSWTCGYQAIWSNKGCEANVLGLQGTRSDLKEPFDQVVKLTFRGYDVGLFCDFYWEQSEITHEFCGGSYRVKQRLRLVTG